MREIREVIFRGKRTDCEAWAEGDLLHYESGEMAICKGFSKYGYEATEIIGRYKVIPKTIGQFTGLTDKNGKRIFEGDILDVSSDVAYGGVAVHRLGYFVVEFHNGCFMKSALDDPQLSFFDNAKRKGLYHFISTDIHKIVGNIHDNPELLQKI